MVVVPDAALSAGAAETFVVIAHDAHVAEFCAVIVCVSPGAIEADVGLMASATVIFANAVLLPAVSVHVTVSTAPEV